jgi:Ca-activated chloride channel homolog
VPALRKAGELLQRVGSPHGEVLLLSDGIDDPADSLNAVRDLRRQGVQTSVMGIGSAQAVPVPAAQGGFETGPDGRVRLARLDESGLAALASAGGGHYQRLGAGRPLDLLRSDAERDPARARAERGGVQRWVEQGPWLLLPLLLIAAGGFRRGWLGVLAVFLVLPPPVHAFSWQDLWLRPDQQASRMLEQGEAAAAARRFQDPAWRATAQYRAGDYAAAAQSFGGQDADSQYNRGNALARAGKLQEAKAAYEAALARNAGDEDARFNRDLVDKLLSRQQTQSGQSGKTGSQQDGKTGSAQAGQSGAQQDRQTGSAHNGQAGGGGQKSAEGKAADAGSADNGQPGSDGQRQDKGAAAGKQPEKPPASDAADRQAMKSPGDGQANPQTGPRTAANNSAGKQQRPPDSADRARSDVAAAADEPPPGGSVARAAQSGDTPGKPGSLADEQQRQPLSEQDVALEQWLRQVPDDPAGLLRRKFMLEHLLRQKERQTP